jgi:hypothetical protein
MAKDIPKWAIELERLIKEVEIEVRRMRERREEMA